MCGVCVWWGVLATKGVFEHRRGRGNPCKTMGSETKEGAEKSIKPDRNHTKHAFVSVFLAARACVCRSEAAAGAEENQYYEGGDIAGIYGGDDADGYAIPRAKQAQQREQGGIGVYADPGSGDDVYDHETDGDGDGDEGEDDGLYEVVQSGKTTAASTATPTATDTATATATATSPGHAAATADATYSGYSAGAASGVPTYGNTNGGGICVEDEGGGLYEVPVEADGVGDEAADEAEEAGRITFTVGKTTGAGVGVVGHETSTDDVYSHKGYKNVADMKGSKTVAGAVEITGAQGANGTAGVAGYSHAGYKNMSSGGDTSLQDGPGGGGGGPSPGTYVQEQHTHTHTHPAMPGAFIGSPWGMGVCWGVGGAMYAERSGVESNSVKEQERREGEMGGLAGCPTPLAKHTAWSRNLRLPPPAPAPCQVHARRLQEHGRHRRKRR